MAKNAKDRDRALAMAKTNDFGIPEADTEMDGDANMEDAEDAATETLGSKVVVIHVGSQNLRIGLSSDALPKTLPMVIARKSTTSESEDHEEPCPKRLKLDDGSEMEPEKKFGPEVCLGSQLMMLFTDLVIVLFTIYNHVSRPENTYATEQTSNPAKL